MARFATWMTAALEALFDNDEFLVELPTRSQAATLFRYIRDETRWTPWGHKNEDGFYEIGATPPQCAGGCGDPTVSVTGMCYQCQCEAHADGWFDHDAGYARV